MTRPFRFAIQGGPFDDPDALAAHARNVESLGYDELFVPDHIVHSGGAGPSAKVDPFLPLLVAATATEQLRVGTLVLNNEFHRPALLARTAATLDRLSGGRLVLGLGTGYAQTEHDAIGVRIRAPGLRVSRFGESLEILRSLLDTGSAEFDGDHESVHVQDLGVRPLQDHVPFLIGGHGPRVVRLAGRFADIFQFTGLVHDKLGAPSAAGFAVDLIDKRSQWLTEAAGERNDQIERSALVQVTHVGDDVPSSTDLAEQFGLDADVITETPFLLAGSVEQIVDKLQRLRERLGISHWVVRDPEGFAPVVAALTP